MTGIGNSGSEPLSKLTIASLKDIGYEVNYDSADDYDGSDTTCCFPSISSPSKPSKPPLSEIGYATAVDYGRKVLNAKQRPPPSIIDEENDDGSLVYIGDQFIVVLFAENENIYDVVVTP